MPHPRLNGVGAQVSAWRLWLLQVLAQMGPQLAAAASLPADISSESGRHGGLRSWTPEEASAEGVPPNHVPRSASLALACSPVTKISCKN
jgi:hypothetical protein